MNMILSKKIHIDRPNRYILTIYVGKDHLSFSLHSPNERGSYIYENIAIGKNTNVFTVFKEVYFDNELFSLPFQKIIIMYDTPVFTFVPNLLNAENYKEDYLNLLFSEKQGVTMNQSISDTGISVIYKMPEDILTFIVGSFDKPQFFHFSAPFIIYFLEKLERVNYHRMVINLCEDRMDVFCFSRNTFLLGNSFSYNSVSEAVYYILFIWEQLKFNQMNDHLLITGNVEYGEKLYEKLKLYIRNIHSLSVLPEIHYAGIETGHIPFELIALSSCV